MSGTVLILTLAKIALITGIVASAARRPEPKRVRIDDGERPEGR